MSIISYDDFEKVELRSGTVVKAEPFPKARNPSYKVWVDFGSELGVKQTPLKSLSIIPQNRCLVAKL